MSRPLLQGNLVRLAALDPGTLAEAEARWSLDSYYWRLLDTSAPLPVTRARRQDELEKSEHIPTSYRFAINTLDDNRFIGFIELFVQRWQSGNAWVGVGIGERDCWGKGYGTDAMRELLRYAFLELNLHRVTLSVFEYNERGLRSYEKAGFVQEGRARKAIQRDGRYWDEIHMGILRGEWERTAREG